MWPVVILQKIFDPPMRCISIYPDSIMRLESITSLSSKAYNVIGKIVVNMIFYQPVKAKNTASPFTLYRSVASRLLTLNDMAMLVWDGLRQAICVKDFSYQNKSLKHFPLKQPNLFENSDDPKKTEYVVAIEWIRIVTIKQAQFKRKGKNKIYGAPCKIFFSQIPAKIGLFS